MNPANVIKIVMLVIGIVKSIAELIGLIKGKSTATSAS
jgi:hypothetical protein